MIDSTCLKLSFLQVCYTKLQRKRSQAKLAHAEFNKLIESHCGMQSVRIRRSGISRLPPLSTHCQSKSVLKETVSIDVSTKLMIPARSCSDAGNWLFSGRTWIDPADPDGRAKLDLHYDNLSILFPAFTASCSLDRLIDAVAAVVHSWSRHFGNAARPMRSRGTADVVTRHGEGTADGAPSRLAAADPSPSPPSPPDAAPEAHAAPQLDGPDRDSEDSDRSGWRGPDSGAWPSTVARTRIAEHDSAADLFQWLRAFETSPAWPEADGGGGGGRGLGAQGAE
jgi:hypothetical protein